MPATTRSSIRGKAPDLVYLWIHNDKIEIRDATHLRGKGAIETGALIKEELKQPEAQVAAIGLAGENRVYMASIEHSNSSASRGVGRDHGRQAAEGDSRSGHEGRQRGPAGRTLRDLQRACTRRSTTTRTAGASSGHEDDETWHVNNFAWGNARERVQGASGPRSAKSEWEETTDKCELRWTGCYNCPKDCHAGIRYPGRQTYFQLKCYSKLTYAMAAYEELDFNYDILSVTQEYGLDGFSTPQVLAFAVELYEAGILTDADVPGLPARHGAGGSSTWSRRSSGGKGSATSWPTASTARPARSARAPRPSTTTP